MNGHLRDLSQITYQMAPGEPVRTERHVMVELTAFQGTNSQLSMRLDHGQELERDWKLSPEHVHSF